MFKFKSGVRGNVIVVAVAIMAASFIFFIWPANIGEDKTEEGRKARTTSVRVPPELILGRVIDSSGVRFYFPDPDKVDLVQYRTDKSQQELIEFYTAKLANSGWNVQTNKSTSDYTYAIFARKNNEALSINIINNKANDPNTVQGLGPLVSITYQGL